MFVTILVRKPTKCNTFLVDLLKRAEKVYPGHQGLPAPEVSPAHQVTTELMDFQVIPDPEAVKAHQAVPEVQDYPDLKALPVTKEIKEIVVFQV